MATTSGNMTFGISTTPLMIGGPKNNDYYWFYGFILPIFAFFGVILNFISFLVFHHTQMQSSCIIYYSALTIADMGNLIFSTCIFTPEVFMTKEDFAVVFPNIFTRFYPLMEISQCLISCYVLGALVDHFLFVFYPMKSARWTTKDRAVTLVFVILGVILIIHIINFFRYYVDAYTVMEIDYLKVCLSEVFASYGFRFYDKYGYFALFIGLMFLTYVIIICTLLKDYHGKMKEARHHIFTGSLRVFKGGRSLKLIISVAICRILMSTGFVIQKFKYFSLFPDLKYIVICYDNPLDSNYTGMLPHYNVLSMGMMTFESAFRIIVYFGFGSQFRHWFWDVVTKCDYGTKEASRKTFADADKKKKKPVKKGVLSEIESPETGHTDITEMTTMSISSDDLNNFSNSESEEGRLPRGAHGETNTQTKNQLKGMKYPKPPDIKLERVGSTKMDSDDSENQQIEPKVANQFLSPEDNIIDIGPPDDDDEYYRSDESVDTNHVYTNHVYM